MKRHLEQVRIDSYGAFTDRAVGPFEQGLNVVFGPNEAGKSTLASFVGGVLFGWEEAHGVRNTYSPKNGERAGELVFSDGKTLRRSRNEDGLQGDSSIAADIDSATFRTMFSLTSDELRSLRNSSDVTARLLTAGSGTGSSPAGAFVEIEQRIARLTARRSVFAQQPGDLMSELGEKAIGSGESASVYALADTLDEKRIVINAARDAVEARKQEDVELNALLEDRDIAAQRLAALNDEIDALNAGKARLVQLEGRLEAQQADLAALVAERDAVVHQVGDVASIDPRLAALDAAGDRSLRDRLDEYADEQAKAARGLDIAKENAATSAAAYEALVEMDDERYDKRRMRVVRTSQGIVPALLAVAFVLAGIPVFVHARDINSLSLTALGIGLIVLGVLMAAAALAIVLRPDKGATALDERQKDAQWVMLQDKKRLDASITAKELVDRDIATFLEQAGLGAAQGSVRQARALLDDARDYRSDAESRRQRVASLDMRIDAARSALEDLESQRDSILERLDIDGEEYAERIDRTIALKTEQRDAFVQAGKDISLRIGELRERLDIASTDRTFDREKLAYQQARVHLREAKHELITLLLAKRMLEKSIAAWESRSQPEVYRKASELFALVTDGAWKRISMTSEGQLIATNAAGVEREVRHLSLGTCQQLYLSLRVAMLLHAQDVGRFIPVLVDDVLVNFDAQRRAGAARILAKLAEKRQVIVFTCHQETVNALRGAQEELNYLEL